jgi:hypothetical protein
MHNTFNEASFDVIDEALHQERLVHKEPSPDSKILNTPIGLALQKHFAEYGDIFKERAEL